MKNFSLLFSLQIKIRVIGLRCKNNHKLREVLYEENLFAFSHGCRFISTE